jgi:hypothetical protein
MLVWKHGLLVCLGLTSGVYGKTVVITIFHGSPCSNRSGSHSMRTEARIHPLAHWLAIYYKPDLVWVQTQGRFGVESFPNIDDKDRACL